MSALHPIADMCGATRDVRLVPIADIAISVRRAVPRASVARRIWVNTAWWRGIAITIRVIVRGSSHGSCTHGCSSGDSGPAIIGSAPCRAAGNTCERERCKWPANDVDEYGRGAISTGQSSFKDIDIESKPVALEFRGFSTTTASRIVEPSLLKADTVAFGGSFAKLSLPVPQSSMMWLVRSCPAARTGRSAKTIEFGATPVSTSLFPCKLTPCELRTMSEGTTSGLVTPPIVFCSGTCGGAGGAVCASTIPDVQSTLTTVMTIKGDNSWIVLLSILAISSMSNNHLSESNREMSAKCQ